MPENTVYVGRGSKWGNPFIAGSKNNQRFAHDDKHAVQLFRLWATKTKLKVNTPNCLRGEIAIDCFQKERERLLSSLHELKGKDLACWCASEESCHADVLLELANKKEGE